jgi:CHASE2 domain-containing sensor protein/tRNA A-37 threonylcarbamoyl transferase component Bud32
MWGGPARRRILGLLAVGLLAAAVGLATHATGLLGRFERDSVDVRFSLRGRQPPPSSVVVVGIDNDSLGQLPRYPFSRRLHARVLENLHAAGARLVVYDISFDRPTTSAADDALFEAARRAAPVVFSTSLISPSGATQVLGGNANLASIGDQAAAADLLPDSDGVLRHTLEEVSGLPTIATAVVRTLNPHVATPGQLNGGWIDFRGPPGTLRTLSFAHVLRDDFNPAIVRGKIAVVGATAPVLQDLHSTSAGSPMSGPEVQGEAIATALAGFPLRSPPGIVTGLIIVMLALLVPLAGMRLETVGVCLVGIGVLALWSVATQLAFNSGTVLDYSDPLAAVVLATGGTALLGMWSDSRERQRLRELFAANDRGLVEQVLHAPGEGRLEPTAIIAGYRLERVVGRGGMGVVYQATQLALERPVAIKLIAAKRAQDPAFRERFKAESRIASSIEHANVVPVYEAGEDDGLLFIAMRLVDGIDLAQLLTAAGALEATRTARVIVQIAGALDAAHARGLVHRDVKPANVLLTMDEPEHAYLTDFGVAKPMGALTRVTRAGQWVGTLDYMAPEQIRGETLDAGADIYALTGLLYHCLTGQTAFPHETDAATIWAHMSAAPPAPSSLRPDLPPDLDTVIARGLAKDPADRFDSASELAYACARALGIAELPAPADSPAVAGQRRDVPPGDLAPTALSD